LKTPNAAYARLMNLLSKPWFWGILPHNCLVFVEEILQAGGATNVGRQYMLGPRALLMTPRRPARTGGRARG
jgi:hypothetical protein